MSGFIDPDDLSLRAARDLGSHAVELHTGEYANARGEEKATALAKLRAAAALLGIGRGDDTAPGIGQRRLAMIRPKSNRSTSPAKPWPTARPSAIRSLSSCSTCPALLVPSARGLPPSMYVAVIAPATFAWSLRTDDRVYYRSAGGGVLVG